ncbi:MAG: adenylate/guanylate cyclase domain-containing protein [Nitrospirae bacterium]|nr:adenylate/guanylate cyclase domain-containing protein [Nitrospirota bacterium]
MGRVKLSKPVQGILIGLCAGVIALFMGTFQFAADLELYTVDMRYKHRPPIKTLPTLGYIDFDDSSLRLFGQWPWPRLRHAVLVNTLDFYNAKAAAFDVFFVERENTVFYPAAMKKFLSINSGSANNNENNFLRLLDDSFRTYDEEFAGAMTKFGNIYLSYYTVRAQEAKDSKNKGMTRPGTPNTGADTAINLLEKTFLPIPKAIDPSTLYADTHISPPLEEFIAAAKGTGYAQPDLDSDSIVRNYTLLRRYDNYMTYPVILKMLSNVMDFKLNDMVIVPGRYLILKQALQYGGDTRHDVTIPIDSRCQMPLNWAGTYRNSYTHLPYDVLSYFYAVIRAKQVASKYAGSSYDELYGDIYADLMEDTLVTEASGRAIASDIAAALLVSELLNRGIKQAEIYQQLKPYVKGDTIDNVYAVVAASVKVEKELMENRGASAANSPGGPYSRQIAEAVKNMKWFYAKGRLKEAYPYYFPDAPRLMRQGEPRAFSPTDMEGMIFMVGLAGTNTIDLDPTPYESYAPMVSFHLNAINSILTGQFLQTAPVLYNRAITIALAVLAGVTGVMVGVVASSAIAVVATAAYAFITLKLWIVKGYRIDLVIPLTGMALAYSTSLVIQFVRMFLERKKVRSLFAKMVSKAVLKTMEENPDSFSLTGQRKAAAVFFSALNGMNEAIRKVSPGELPALLSVYLSPNSEIIMNYGGYIDKYEGHVIMADFGVPVDDELCAVKCAFSAIEQRLDIEAFKFYVETAYGLSVNVAMGFNYGYVSAGNMGSEEKFQYTVMGDPVNVAARFMAANFIYNSNYAITGEDAVPVISDFVHLRLLDKLLLKGKTKPLAIYDCIGWRPEAYLKLHSGKPVPAHIKALWLKCPTGKIFGYLRMWEKIYKKTSHPLAETIWKFFTACPPIIEPLLISKLKGEVTIFHTSVIAFKHNLKETQGHHFSDSDVEAVSDSLHVYLNVRQEELTKIVGMLEESAVTGHPDGALTEELAQAARALLYKCEMLLSRFQNEHIEDDHILRCTGALRDFVPGKEALDNHRLNATIADGQSRYQAMAGDFCKKLSGEAGAWHEMMSLAGAPTQEDLAASGLFEEALTLYWERRWDDAIEIFQKVLRYVPDDAPARSFINRIELYKETPPPELWQGEFVQTKK